MESDTAHPKRVSQAELARLLGVSRAAVSKAVKANRITPGDDGLFDLEQAITDWRNNTRTAVKTASGLGPVRSRGGQTKYAAARARKEHYLANLAEMREQHLLGILCKTKDVESAGTEVGTIIRARLEGLSSKLYGQLAHRDMDAIAEIIDREMEQLLREISADIIKRITEAVRPEKPNGQQP